MMLALFDQFMTPTFLYIPLILLSMTLPWILITNQHKKWTVNCLTTIQSWFLFYFTKQLMATMNMKGQKWALLLTSLMTFLILTNLLGLLPYTFTPTTQLSMNMALAIPMWLATVLLGMRHQMTTSLGHLLPEGTPTLLIPPPPPVLIETISLFIRPLALGIRLTANLTASHLLIQLISTASLLLMPTMPTISFTTTMILLMLTVLELAVAMIQAYVFVLLLTMYFQENI